MEWIIESCRIPSPASNVTTSHLLYTLCWDSQKKSFVSFVSCASIDDEHNLRVGEHLGSAEGVDPEEWGQSLPHHLSPLRYNPFIHRPLLRRLIPADALYGDYLYPRVIRSPSYKYLCLCPYAECPKKL